MITLLREAHRAVEQARARGDTALDQQVIDDLRERYDKAIAHGIIHNRLRDWHDGNHPGYALGCWLRDYKDQVLLFTTDFRVDWTNDLASYCTSWVRSAVSGFSRWSGGVAGVVFSMACGTDIRQRAAEAGVVAAS
jgi:transposase